MISFDLQKLKASERFGYWREVLCNVYVSLTPEPDDRFDFSGSVSDHDLNGIGVSKISSKKQIISRTPSGIRRDADAFYFLNLQTRGACGVVQLGQEQLTKQGEFVIVDSTEPFSLDYVSEDWEQYSFKIPKQMFDAHIGASRTALLKKVSTESAVGDIVVNYLTSMARRAVQLDTNPDEIRKSMFDLIRLGLTEGEDGNPYRHCDMRSGLRQYILNFIELNFSDPTLNPAKAAAHFNISTRYLHKVLEEHELTFSQALLERRLQSCAEDLKSGRPRNISEVAFRWGFNDLSHFSRAFRRRYGTTPREYRRSEMEKSDF